ncbi:hypothetical protein CF394_10960 [Tetzosporium hominis]|uniref:Uncharacterized protein n=1 Tax=Tetzosporium hominis TaxID=2020506 RepID=A0A264W2B2_9BACL|nr:hypothetical protein CF394_10960 [Tetzosporium hominis]
MPAPSLFLVPDVTPPETNGDRMNGNDGYNNGNDGNGNDTDMMPDNRNDVSPTDRDNQDE